MLLWATILGCTPEDPDDTDPVVYDIAVRPGVEMVTVSDREPGDPLTLYTADGTELLTLLADENGNAHFSYVPTAPFTIDTRGGYVFPLAEGDVLVPGSYVIESDTGESSGPFEVLAIDDVPDPSHYDQELTGAPYSLISGEVGDPQVGFQYLEMRDGTLLSAMVRFPDPQIYGDGPFPTVVEYSGYSPSRPDRAGSSIRIANALGYAVVGVNMRGSGCSGGVFDVFNRGQHADGYDIVEIVARQSWAMNGKVGMVGISYPGISQLYVASTNPPSLGAIVPLSVIADAWEMQYPGGAYNDGFTQQWLDQRDAEAEAQGTSWVAAQVELGDTTCETNQILSTQNIDFEAFFAQLEMRPPAADDRDLSVLVEQIEAPVFLAGGWQDEQTGAAFGGLTDRFLSSADARFLLYNGRHPDGFAPDAIHRWFEFLEFHVAERTPELPALLKTAIGASEFGAEFGISDYRFPDDRFEGLSYDDALEAYAAEDPVRILFESGAGGPDVGAPIPTFETSMARWPAPDASDVEWHLGPGTLGTLPATDGEVAFSLDPDAADQTFFGPDGYQLLVPLWDIDWTRFAPEDEAVLTTAPFAADRVLVGPAIAELWVRTPVEDTALQATLTELRPDGTEVLVQSGWLRLGHRAATPGPDRRLDRSYAVEDYAPMPLDTWEPVQIAIPSFAHPFRAGSQLALRVSSPGRNHGTWTFTAPEPATLELGFGPGRPSRLVIGELDGLQVPPDYPPCPSLRGQPCR